MVKRFLALVFLLSYCASSFGQQPLVLKESSFRKKYRLFLKDQNLPFINWEFGTGYGAGVASSSSQSFEIKPIKRVEIYAIHARVSFNFYPWRKENPYFLKLLSPQFIGYFKKDRQYLCVGTPGLGFGKHFGITEKKRLQLSVNFYAINAENYQGTLWFVPVIQPQIKLLSNRFTISFEACYLPHKERIADMTYQRQTYYFGISLGFTNRNKNR